MGLYNMLHGVNPVSLILLRALDLRHHKLNPDGVWPTGRFRDIHLSGEGDKLILFTRNGGGNRDCWEEEECKDASSPVFHGPGCLVYVNWKLTTHPLYVRGYDDDFDYTYASFEFRVPAGLDHLLDRILEAQGGAPRSFQERFLEVMDEIKSMSREELEQDPRFKPMVDVVKKIGEAVG